MRQTSEKGATQAPGSGVHEAARGGSSTRWNGESSPGAPRHAVGTHTLAGPGASGVEGAEEQPQPEPTPLNPSARTRGTRPAPVLWATRRPRPAWELPLAKATTSPGTHPVVGPLSLSLQRSLDPLPHLSHPAGLSLKDPKAHTHRRSKRSPSTSTCDLH